MLGFFAYIFQQVIHQIGNLNELGRVDNSRKNDSTLESWLKHADPIRNSIRKTEFDNVVTIFGISDEISNPIALNRQSVDIIINSISLRSKVIKKDIISYLELS